MNHGRSIALSCLAAALLAARAKADLPAATAPSPFRITCGLPDHPSGLYYVKGEAKVALTVDNTSGQAQEFSGEIAFGPAASGGDVNPLSVTPVETVTVAAGQRVKIPLSLTFGAAGDYQLNWHRGNAQTPIEFAPENTGVGLRCIFAPRAAKAEESPWLAVLPPAAVRVPGLLTDYSQQTTVWRFLIDERFAYDAKTNVGLGFGASTGAGAAAIDNLLAEAARAKVQLYVRVSVPLAQADDPKVIDAFRTYLFDAIRRCHGTLAAIAITPEQPPQTAWTDIDQAAFRTFYLAGYEAAKHADKNVQLLGAGSAQATADLLLQKDPRLIAFVDALALSDAAGEPARAAPLLAAQKLPLVVLPPRSGKAAPPAAALAQHATIVPIPEPETDNGVTAHLLNGTVFYKRLSISIPTADPTVAGTSNIPFIALFQGDGYTVAAIAGFSAGTDLDGQYPALAGAPTHVEPLKPDDKPYPNLEVGDDTHSMRVVDAAGAPVDCRIGDSVFVPAADAMVYLLQGGSAEDLAGTLLPATAHRLPLLEITATQAADGKVKLRLHNISVREQSGTLRLIRPPTAGDQAAAELAAKDFSPIEPGKQTDVSLDVAAQPGGTLVAEITTTGPSAAVQRTAVTLQRAEH